MKRYCEASGRSIALQGEICGPGIQKNPLGLDEVQFFVFDIFDIDAQRYVPASERHKLIVELNNDDLGDKIQHVPVICYLQITPHLIMIAEAYRHTLNVEQEKASNPGYQGPLSDDSLWPCFLDNVVAQVVQNLVDQAEGKTFTGHGEREGLVFKSVQDTAKSFKVINNTVLLNEKA